MGGRKKGKRGGGGISPLLFPRRAGGFGGVGQAWGEGCGGPPGSGGAPIPGWGNVGGKMREGGGF